jgi:hypothetical protein
MSEMGQALAGVMRDVKSLTAGAKALDPETGPATAADPRGTDERLSALEAAANAIIDAVNGLADSHNDLCNRLSELVRPEIQRHGKAMAADLTATAARLADRAADERHGQARQEAAAELSALRDEVARLAERQAKAEAELGERLRVVKENADRNLQRMLFQVQTLCQDLAAGRSGRAVVQ